MRNSRDYGRRLIQPFEIVYKGQACLRLMRPRIVRKIPSISSQLVSSAETNATVYKTTSDHRMKEDVIATKPSNDVNANPRDVAFN
jgi:hypothetical protein